jgi:hypothetical protein
VKYDVWYGRHGREPVSSVTELDAVLDVVQRQRGDGGAPYAVTIVPAVEDAEFDELPGLQIGIGNDERAFVFFSTADGHGTGYGFEPGTQEWSTILAWDYSGQWTDYEPAKTRITPATAREAARQYIATGRRPTCVQWSHA